LQIDRLIHKNIALDIKLQNVKYKIKWIKEKALPPVTTKGGIDAFMDSAILLLVYGAALWKMSTSF